ncbi:MAG TPA: hypothetical protein VG276_12945 [Actinomycetes bacterium]|nr:hypothetical protein [Actinomycetes bacterium]
MEDKTRRYAGLAEALGVPLLVAVGAHRFTGRVVETGRTGG